MHYVHKTVENAFALPIPASISYNWSPKLNNSPLCRQILLHGVHILWFGDGVSVATILVNHDYTTKNHSYVSPITACQVSQVIKHPRKKYGLSVRHMWHHFLSRLWSLSNSAPSIELSPCTIFVATWIERSTACWVAPYWFLSLIANVKKSEREKVYKRAKLVSFIIRHTMRRVSQESFCVAHTEVYWDTPTRRSVHTFAWP